MSKILELREKEQRHGRQQKHSLMPREHRKALCPLRMQQPTTRWKMMS